MAQLDLRIVERLVFSKLQAAESVTLKVLMPGEQPPTDPAIVVAQLVGVECAFSNQGAGADGADSADITAIVTVHASPEVTEADASQIQTAVSTILLAMRRTSATSGTHQVDLDNARTRMAAPDEQLPAARIIVIEIGGNATRSSGTSLE